MSTAAAVTGSAKAKAHAVRPDEFRSALERTLVLADADERIGPLIAATRLRLRFEFTDCDLALNLAAAEGRVANLSWSFADDPGWPPKLVLRMTCAVGNRYMQGRESLAIAIARGHIRCHGESRAVLLYLPAARLICEPYRKVVEAEFPDLATQ